MISRSKNFRADIGGLRAVSILAVLWFHFSLGFSGGYSGVDVFFVVSGFLITSSIVRDLEAGEFRFGRFWERRIKRLMPALIPVILFCCVVGAWILSPQDYRELGVSIIFQAFAGSNLYFWKVWDTGYFADDVETRVLLHSWSLSVEEQFYFFLPLLVWAGFRLAARKGVEWGLIGICLSSLILSVALTPVHQSFAFYGLFTRAWELALGGIVSVKRLERTFLPVRFREFLVCLAGFALVAGFVFLEKTSVFPGYLALIPCVSTAILLAFAPGTIVGRVLAWNPLVFVGEISYSLYLWHWPLWALAFYGGVITSDSTLWVRLALVLVSFLIACVTWRWVEVPCRFSKSISAWLILGVYQVVACGLAVVLILGQGWPGRWSAQALSFFGDKMSWSKLRSFDLPKYRAGADFYECGAILGESKRVATDYLVWGDSHAKSLFPVLDSVSRSKKLRGYAVSMSSAPPFLVEGTIPGAATSLRGGSPERRAWMKVPFDARKRGIDKLILVGRWSNYCEGKPLATLERTLRSLREMGFDVCFIGDVPRQSFHPPRRLALSTRFGFLSTAPTGPDRMEELSLLEQVKSLALCRCFDTGSVILSLPSLEVDGHSVYTDSHHLTEYGAGVLSPLVEEVLERWGKV